MAFSLKRNTSLGVTDYSEDWLALEFQLDVDSVTPDQYAHAYATVLTKIEMFEESVVLTAGRHKLVRGGRLLMFHNRKWQERYFILFSDMIVWAKFTKVKSKFKFKGQFNLHNASFQQFIDNQQQQGKVMKLVSADGQSQLMLMGLTKHDTTSWATSLEACMSSVDAPLGEAIVPDPSAEQAPTLARSGNYSDRFSSGGSGVKERPRSLILNQSGSSLGGDRSHRKALTPVLKSRSVALRTSGEGVGRERSVTSPVFQSSSNAALDDSLPTLPKTLKDEITMFQFEEFAKTHFRTMRKKHAGLRKKAIPLDQLLVYSEKPIKDSLLNCASSAARKEAPAIFKKILSFMQLDSGLSGAQRAQLAVYILERGFNDTDLRDEIFCQLMKQATDNPNWRSCEAVWQLFLWCCGTFTPSKTFEEQLFKVLDERMQSVDELTRRGAYLARTELNFLCNRHIPGRLPLAETLEVQLTRPLQRSVFRNSLSNIMMLQSATHPYLQVPLVLVFLTSLVTSLGGHQLEGIFRVAANDTKVNLLRSSVEMDAYQPPDVKNAHIPACLLKQWLRELQEPLIPGELYQQCVEAADQSPRACVDIVDQQLTGLSKRVFSFLIEYLRSFLTDEAQARTKMSAHNLGVVFAPCCMKSVSGDAASVMGNSQREATFIQNVIEGGL